MDKMKKGLTNFRAGGAVKVKQAQQAANTLRKKLANQPIHEDGYSESFIRNKVKLKRTRFMIEQLVKLMGEHSESGINYAATIKKLADFLMDVVEESDPSERCQEDRKMMLIFANTLVSISDSLNQMIKDSDLLIQTFIEQMSREVKEVRQIKSECYQAYQESQANKAKLSSISKNDDPKMWLEAQQSHTQSSSHFSHLQMEVINKMEDFDHHKNVCMLESFNYFKKMQESFFKGSLQIFEKLDENLEDEYVPISQKRVEYEEQKESRQKEAEQLLKIAQLKRGVSLPTVIKSSLSEIEKPELPDILPGEETIFSLDKVIRIGDQLTTHIGQLTCTNYRLIYSAYSFSISQEDVNRFSSKDRNSSQSSISFEAFSQHEKFQIPLMCIERLEKSDSEQKLLGIWCKDLRLYTFSLRHSEKDFSDISQTLYDYSMRDDEECFALSHYSIPDTLKPTIDGWKLYEPNIEFERQGVEVSNPKWRMSTANINYKLCDTYPSVLVIPSNVTDEEITKASEFRSKKRIPCLTWLSEQGAAIFRSSQPRVGLKRSHSAADQLLLRDFAAAGGTKRLFVCDARPKVSALGNAAIGGGWEDTDNYTNCNVEFLGIENIHAVREAYIKFRKEMTSGNKTNDELLKLDWFKYNSSIISSGARVSQIIKEYKTSVLVHCSDGWDRTPQITSIAQIILDPFYRTLHGFLILIEKEWVSFGHKFSRRYGNGEHRENYSDSQRSPIFIQWLDCIFQIVSWSPNSFEFTTKLLEFLVNHLYSCRFGNFLHDNEKERQDKKVKERTVSIWALVILNSNSFTNQDYKHSQDLLLDTSLKVWDVYKLLGDWKYENF